MSTEIDFRQAVVNAATSVMRCEYCNTHAPQGDQPQPGWVGGQYRPGWGIVVLLQNPGAAPADYGTRELTGQKLLKTFADSPTIDSYTQLMRFMIADIAGCSGGRAWSKWVHPVSKLVSVQDKLAWMNVVKYRTPGTARKDDPVANDAVRHSLGSHLQQELDVLNPRAIVSIGSVARSAIYELRLPPGTMTGHLKLQGAGSREVQDLRQQLLAAGADI